MSKEEKYYTPEEAAAIVLEKAHKLMKKSELFKNNTSHEIEMGEEPSNDDAECPEYLAEADIEDDYKEDEKRKGGGKKAKSDDSESESESEDDVSDEEADAMEDIAEEEVDEHNDQLHEGQDHNNEDDEDEDEDDDDDDDDDEDSDEIIEDAANEDDKKKKKMDKSEKKMKPMTSKEDYDLDQSGKYAHGSIAGKDKDQTVEKAIAATEEMKTDLKKPKKRLKKFMLKRKMKKAGGYPTEEARRRADKEGKTRMATPQESTAVADRKGYTRMTTPKEKEQLKQSKNKKMEKMLGVKPKTSIKGGY